jgi:hypothetical protein
MTTIADYTSIQSNLFVRIEIPEYSASSGDAYTEQVLRFSDLREPYTINDEEYIGTGNLMGITASTSELSASAAEMVITLSGIPNSSIAEIVNSKIKGCPVRIYRVIFDPTNGSFLNIDNNPMVRYRGFVNSYGLTEDWDSETRTSSNTITIVCASSYDVLSDKTSGRKTNPSSQRSFYPNDSSMDRVPVLENATFDFGAPK